MYRIPTQDLRNTNLCLDSVSSAYQSPEAGPQKYRSVFLTRSVPCTRVQKQDLRNTGQCLQSRVPESRRRISEMQGSFFDSCQTSVPESRNRTSEIQVSVLTQSVPPTRVQKQDLRNTGQCRSPVYQSPEAGPQKYRSVS